MLWLSLLEFPNKEQNLPPDLTRLTEREEFEICWVKENLKPHKKYFYVLQKYIKDIIITVDDDIDYSSTMVEELLDAYYKFPNAIIARNVRLILRENEKIASYDIWSKECEEYRQQERQDLCAIGWGGILYPPYVAKGRWFDKYAIENFCVMQDDLWLKFNEIIDKIPVVYIGKKKEDTIIEGAQKYALYKNNISGNQNNVCLSNLYKWSKEIDCETIETWLCNLIDSTIFYVKKRETYVSHLRTVLKEKKEYIYICGAGKYAKVVIKLFEYINKSDMISGLIVSDYEGNPKKIYGIPVYSLDDVKVDKNTLVICGVSLENRKALKPYFDNKFCEWLDLDLYMILNCFRILHGTGEQYERY